MFRSLSVETIIKSTEYYQSWLASLQKGDKCIFQEFVPRGSGGLGVYLPEFWGYWPAEYINSGCIQYDGDTHTIEDGINVFFKGGDVVNKVFPGRVVPYSKELVSSTNPYVASNRPVYEPNWLGDRCYLKTDLLGWNRGRKILKGIPHHVEDINEGLLITCFCRKYNLLKLITEEEELEGIEFMYSEKLHT